MEHSVQARSIRWFYAATDADWDALFTEQLPRVYNFFRYRVGIRAEAEDLASITFERAWRARHRYRPGASHADGFVRLRVGSEESLPLIVKSLVDQGVGVYGLQSRRRSLEQLFLDIMGDDQRPG